MSIKALIAAPLLLLAACSENEGARPALANESAVQVPQPSGFDPDDSHQEQQDKAEARGAAQANTAIQSDRAEEDRRKADGPQSATRVED